MIEATAADFDERLHALIKETYIAHKRIIFNGNGYDDAWIRERTAADQSQHQQDRDDPYPSAAFFLHSTPHDKKLIYYNTTYQAFAVHFFYFSAKFLQERKSPGKLPGRNGFDMPSYKR